MYTVQYHETVIWITNRFEFLKLGRGSPVTWAIPSSQCSWPSSLNNTYIPSLSCFWPGSLNNTILTLFLAWFTGHLVSNIILTCSWPGSMNNNILTLFLARFTEQYNPHLVLGQVHWAIPSSPCSWPGSLSNTILTLFLAKFTEQCHPHLVLGQVHSALCNTILALFLVRLTEHCHPHLVLGQVNWALPSSPGSQPGSRSQRSRWGRLCRPSWGWTPSWGRVGRSLWQCWWQCPRGWGVASPGPPRTSWPWSCWSGCCPVWGATWVNRCINIFSSTNLAKKKKKIGTKRLLNYLACNFIEFFECSSLLQYAAILDSTNYFDADPDLYFHKLYLLVVHTQSF